MEMFINGKDILLKPINQGNLFLLKQWYEQVDSYGFATGGKSVKDILPVDENSFILGIFITPENKCIGVISGDFKQAKQPVLWIKTFMIDAVWQRKRYGTLSFNILCDYASQQFGIKCVYISVSKENLAGIAFWNKMGMNCIKVIPRGEPLSSILIFEKVI
ncbi:MAG: GNAT family N-acetyltransferase [Clostridiaceae bacterium]|jgi:RimJ/RimL family protein N-acetyltransferase|nr:GNAT family N-acetyltransferase [Clostridiaceae bacterium]